MQPKLPLTTHANVQQPYQSLVNKALKIDEKYKEEEDDGGRNGKQQYDNISLLGEETKNDNTEEIGTASSLHTESMTILPQDIQIALQYTS